MQKQESFYTKIHDVLSWKKIAAFNLLLLLVFVVPLSVRLAQQSTENRSGAAAESTPSPEPPVNYPADSPKIERVLMFFGKPGDTVVLMGDNFGDYKWESKLYVGNTKVEDDDIVRWGNQIIEVEIPNQARTGKVWVEVDNKTASWDGSLFLYDVDRSTKVGLEKESGDGYFWTEKASEIARGTLEFGLSAGGLSVESLAGVRIENQQTSADDFGNKYTVSFVVEGSLARSKARLIKFVKQVGKLELIQVEMFDSEGNLISVYSEPRGTEISF